MDIVNTILDVLTRFGDELLAAAGQSPFAAMGYIMTHGGLILFFPMMVWMLWWVWVYYVAGLYSQQQKYVLLAVDVPAVNEQSMRAVEQMLVALHGVLFGLNRKDMYWHGMQIEPFSLEIASIDGYIQYFIHTNVRFVDVVKGAVYAQYPDAEIIEVEDYTPNVPNEFPNEEYNCWGTELQLAKSSVYPLRTYEYFEHSLTGTFADPMASVLEQMSRLQPGEQLWLQFVITPTGPSLRDEGIKEVQKLIGGDGGYSPSAVERMIFGTLDTTFRSIMPATWEVGPDANAGREGEKGDFMGMTTGDRLIVEEIQKKITKLQFDTKIRVVYVAKKERYDNLRIVGSVFGALKQYNSLDLNSLVGGKWTSTHRPTYLFFKQRRNQRMTKLVKSYQSRSNWNGENPITLSTTELATLFHFPLESVQAPLLSSTQSKKAEPPTRLPQQLLPLEPEQPEEEVVPEEPLPSEAPVGQRIPREDEELVPGTGIPSRSAEGPRTETGPAFVPEHTMAGLPPGVTPVQNADWQDAQEWSLSKREQLGYGRREPESLVPRTQDISQTVNQFAQVIPVVAKAVPQALTPAVSLVRRAGEVVSMPQQPEVREPHVQPQPTQGPLQPYRQTMQQTGAQQQAPAVQTMPMQQQAQAVPPRVKPQRAVTPRVQQSQQPRPSRNQSTPARPSQSGAGAPPPNLPI